MKKKILIAALALAAVPAVALAARYDAKLVDRFRGRILLQVQQHGEAWYLNPADGKRYYLRDGAAAYDVLRKFGQGMADADLDKIPVGTLSGAAAPAPTAPANQATPTPPSPAATSRIPGLAAIRFSGGTWDNWDADIADDGPVVDVVYLDGSGNIISDASTKTLPISASVRVYTKKWINSGYVKDRLVYSAEYPASAVILGSIYPEMRIPREQITADPAVDYRYGIAEITVQTPEQGAFASANDSLPLYE